MDATALFKSNDTDVLRTRLDARTLRNVLADQGHKAVVEGHGREHRVRVHHPDDKTTIAYARPEDFKAGKFKPVWIAK